MYAHKDVVKQDLHNEVAEQIQQIVLTWNKVENAHREKNRKIQANSE